MLPQERSDSCLLKGRKSMLKMDTVFITFHQLRPPLYRTYQTALSRYRLPKTSENILRRLAQ